MVGVSRAANASALDETDAFMSLVDGTAGSAVPLSASCASLLVPVCIGGDTRASLADRAGAVDSTIEAPAAGTIASAEALDRLFEFPFGESRNAGSPDFATIIVASTGLGLSVGEASWVADIDAGAVVVDVSNEAAVLAMIVRFGSTEADSCLPGVSVGTCGSESCSPAVLNELVTIAVAGPFPPRDLAPCPVTSEPGSPADVTEPVTVALTVAAALPARGALSCPVTPESCSPAGLTVLVAVARPFPVRELLSWPITRAKPLETDLAGLSTEAVCPGPAPDGIAAIAGAGVLIRIAVRLLSVLVGTGDGAIAAPSCVALFGVQVWSRELIMFWDETAALFREAPAVIAGPLSRPLVLSGWLGAVSGELVGIDMAPMGDDVLPGTSEFPA